MITPEMGRAIARTIAVSATTVMEQRRILTPELRAEVSRELGNNAAQTVIMLLDEIEHKQAQESLVYQRALQAEHSKHEALDTELGELASLRAALARADNENRRLRETSDIQGRAIERLLNRLNYSKRTATTDNPTKEQP